MRLLKNRSVMPKERTIPGYFDEIEGFAETYYVGKEVPAESPYPTEEAVEKKVRVKGKKGRPRKKTATDQQNRNWPARAFISEELNMMLGLYKMRVRHIWSTNRSYGEILEDAFRYYIKHHDREAHDEYVSKGLIR